MVFYPNGNPKIICNYKNDQLHGRFESYYDINLHQYNIEAKPIETLANYKNGLLDGKLYKLHRNGDIKSVTTCATIDNI